MKTTKARIETIRGRILDASSRAQRNHGVIKDSFLIDIGHVRLTRQLRRDLERYNFDSQGNPLCSYRLARLWVMSEDGAHIKEIRVQR